MAFPRNRDRVNSSSGKQLTRNESEHPYSSYFARSIAGNDLRALAIPICFKCHAKCAELNDSYTAYEKAFRQFSVILSVQIYGS